MRIADDDLTKVKLVMYRYRPLVLLRNIFLNEV